MGCFPQNAPNISLSPPPAHFHKIATLSWSRQAVCCYWHYRDTFPPMSQPNSRACCAISYRRKSIWYTASCDPVYTNEATFLSKMRIEIWGYQWCVHCEPVISPVWSWNRRLTIGTPQAPCTREWRCGWVCMPSPPECIALVSEVNQRVHKNSPKGDENNWPSSKNLLGCMDRSIFWYTKLSAHDPGQPVIKAMIFLSQSQITWALRE